MAQKCRFFGAMPCYAEKPNVCQDGPGTNIGSTRPGTNIGNAQKEHCFCRHYGDSVQGRGTEMQSNNGADTKFFGAKNASFAFYLEHFIICQDRLGTDIQQTQKKTTTYTVFVFAGNAEARYYWHDLKALIDGRGNHPSIYQVLVKKERKTAGFGPSTVDLKNLMAIVSPRPARDKRRGR